MSSEETAPVRVALVDDQALIRSGLAMLVDSQPDLTVVAEAGSGREAVASVSVAGADVVLMDVRMPEMDGIEATRALLRRPDAPRVVVLTTFDLDEYAFDAIEAGASGFLLKDAPPEELLAAIRTVHRGDAVFSPRLAGFVLDAFDVHARGGVAVDAGDGHGGGVPLAEVVVALSTRGPGEVGRGGCPPG